jgi:hypothetical protein
MKQLMEGKTGQEQHASSWGKFYLHGIKLVAEARCNNSHESSSTGAVEVSDGVIFTVWMASGNRRGTDSSDYYILLADSAQEAAELTNGYGMLTGRWQVLAHGDGTVRAPRLLLWAKDRSLTEREARHLGAQIKLRDKAQPDPMPDEPWAPARPNKLDV